jgi:hypothetical protein
VFLKQGAQTPVEILEFSHQYATMYLTMEWQTPTHLQVTYGPGRAGDTVTVDFQAVWLADVAISLRNASAGSAK